MITFQVPGDPQGKARPRVTRGGKHTYTPRKTKDYQELIRMCCPNEWMEGEIAMAIVAYFKIPKSKPKKERELMNKGKISPTKKPDLDNIMKSVADALNGVLYKDDSQIVACTLQKLYSETPGLVISVSELKKEAE